MLKWLKFWLIPFFLFSGCGDLEPEMQDTRSVVLKMNFHQRSSSRNSQISQAEVTITRHTLFSPCLPGKTSAVITGIITAALHRS